MGMDVFGKQPVGTVGKHFGNNIWWWHPLADYVCRVAPDLTAGCEQWHTNDGDGLNGEDAVRLSTALDTEIRSGRTAAFGWARNQRIAALDAEPCWVCGATGRRLPPPHVGPGDVPCNGCGGARFTIPAEASFKFSVENVTEFTTFLHYCGGFEIC